MDLLDLKSAGLDPANMAAKPYGFNMLQYVFSDEAVSHFQDLMGQNGWREYASQNVMIFRTLTLRYRTTKYFKELFRELNRYKDFEHYWSKAQFWEKDHFVDNEEICLKSPERGHLVFFSTSVTALTTLGDLYFCVYVPATPHTVHTFSQMVKRCSTDMIPLASWPKKKTWHR